MLQWCLTTPLDGAKTAYKKKYVSTHKVFPGSQPERSIFLQKALQQRPGRVGRAGAHYQRLVQNVVIHLMRVPAVKRRLEKKDGNYL